MEFAQQRVDVVSLFAEDVAATASFYQEVLGLPLLFEDEHSAVFQLDNLMINVREVAEAHALIAPARVAGPESGSRFLLALFVDDADAACAELVQRGVTLLNGPTNQAWGTRTACFADPAGHIWEIVQDLD